MDNEKQDNLSKVLKYIRIANDVPMRTLAKELGVSQTYLSFIESGKTNINDEIVRKYSTRFDIDEAKIRYFEETTKRRKLCKQQILLMILEFVCKRYGNEDSVNV